MTGPGGYPAAPEKKRPAWVVGGVTIVSFVVLLYVIEIFDSLSGHHLDNNGIRPLETDGLTGIIFAPLLHSNWEHLIANTVPALILGFLMTLAGLSRFIFATAIIWILGGFGTWLIGNVGAHCPTSACVRDQPHRRFRPDLRLAGVPHRVRVLHPQGVGDRRRRDRAVHLRRRPARRAAGHLRGVVAGPLLRRCRRRDRRVPVVRARTEGPRSAQARDCSTAVVPRDAADERRARSKHWRLSGSSIPASADSPSRGRSSTSCPTRTSSTSGTPATAPTVR